MATPERPAVKPDCRHFRGDIPCTPHKQHGVHCVDAQGATCPHYDPVRFTVLIIKLGAIGDVIRTTPILTRLREVHSGLHVTWLTQSPEILPSIVDCALPYTMQSVIALRSMEFDLLINLDKDRDACAIADQVHAVRKKGFILKNNVVAPVNKEADHKFMTGVFNDVSLANRKSYPQELFELCGFEFAGEKYLLDAPKAPESPWKLNRKKTVVGLNTGCGGRWTSRLWADERWAELAGTLKRKGYEVVLLGGEQEDAKNKALAKASGAKYPGHFPLPTFMSLIDACDMVVTGVTMAMHLTIGLGKKIVLFNNIFNRYEFELYGLGEILEPERPCTCFYKPVCTNTEYRCMELLSVSTVVDACLRVLPPSDRQRT